MRTFSKQIFSQKRTQNFITEIRTFSKIDVKIMVKNKNCGTPKSKQNFRQKKKSKLHLNSKHSNFRIIADLV